MEFNTLCDSHVHDSALDRTLPVELDDLAVLSALDIFHCFHAGMYLLSVLRQTMIF